MRVLLIALGICVSSAVVSASFFLTVFENGTEYDVVKTEPAVEAEPEVVPTPEVPPTIDMAALSQKGLSPDALARKRARYSYRPPIPRQNPFDEIVDISELTAVSGEDLDSQTGAFGLAPTVELAKEQLDELSDDRTLSAATTLAPDSLDDITVLDDPASLGLLGVIIDTALNGGQTVNTNRDVGPATPSIQIGQ